MKHPAIRKYLERHAEKDTFTGFSGHFSHAVVIPIAKEGPLFLDTIESIRISAIECGAAPLVICVINGRADDAAAERDNFALRHRLWELGSVHEHDAQWSTVTTPELALLVCSRFSEGLFFGPKEGVGTARKIGCDLALSFIREGVVASPWIRSTDADVSVDTDYFEDINEEAAALTLPFTHKPAPEALELYEMSLRYYVLGLAFAGSPYAFHTVGSTLVIHGEYYAKVRGFPKRLAAEDFYILNKLAKTGAIVRPRRQPLRIRHRESERAPFGTGPAVRKITENMAQGINYRLYHPQAFHRLKDALLSFEAVVREQSLAPLKEVLGGFDPGWRGLEKMLGQGCSADILFRQLHSHFDAFRTLKWIHYLRDTSLPTLPWRDAIDQAEFIALPRDTTPTPQALAKLEERIIKTHQGVAVVRR